MANIVDTGRVESNTVDNYMVDLTKDTLKYAFNRKFTVHAGAKRASVAKEDLPAKYGDLLQNSLGEPSVIYVHIPFCQTKCLYCGFAGARPTAARNREYMDALIREAKFIGEIEQAGKTPIRAVYFGGGTPSAMAPELMGEFIAVLKESFNLANDCEITLEGRVSDMRQAEGFTKAGFSRFSIGVQSFHTDIRRRLGRINTREEVIEILSALVNLQAAAIIIDLIYGLPGQTVAHFIEDLLLAEELGLDGLDTYQLNVFPDSTLAKAIEAGKVPHAAKLEEQGAYYAAACEHLTGRRWHQLSISHYGRTSRERNIYNPWAKSDGNCIALGAGAGGKLSGYSTYRTPIVEKYLEMAKSGIFVPDAISMPSPLQKLNAVIVTQIEKGFFNYGNVLKHFDIASGEFEKLLENWRKAGLIEMRGDESFDLTVNGRFWGVNISQALINVLYGV